MAGSSVSAVEEDQQRVAQHLFAHALLGVGGDFKDVVIRTFFPLKKDFQQAVGQLTRLDKFGLQGTPGANTVRASQPADFLNWTFRQLDQGENDSGLHEGVFSLVRGGGNEIGEALVDHPLIKGVTFTGSEGGGMAMRGSDLVAERTPAATSM